MNRVEDLADASGIGRTTLVAIETGRKVATASMYSMLELALDLPIGTMERVVAGEAKEFPEAEPRQSRRQREEQLYAELDAVVARLQEIRSELHEIKIAEEAEQQGGEDEGRAHGTG
ncbi:hypothetical protein BAY59_10975 [Prauserella coralliicola]|nr:hypothetical protein BAY59_10975 [Prauserella coralliicola]